MTIVPTPVLNWPTGFTPEEADQFAHDEIFVEVPCSTVWRHLVAAPRWPTWYPNAANVVVHADPGDRLGPESTFELDTLGLHFDAAIAEFAPESRLGWLGSGPGIDDYHTWLLLSDAGGCQVVTEEVAKGPAALAMRVADPEAMHRRHQLWLTGLKRRCER